MNVSWSLCFQRLPWEEHFYRHQTPLQLGPTFHPDDGGVPGAGPSPRSRQARAGWAAARGASAPPPAAEAPPAARSQGPGPCLRRFPCGCGLPPETLPSQITELCMFTVSCDRSRS